MRKAMLLLLANLLVFCQVGCGQKSQKFHATYLDLFDTVTQITGVESEQSTFDMRAQQIHDMLQQYHRLFDIYSEYPGMNNLKTVNDNAGIAPVAVDDAVLALLLDCKEYYALTDGKVNAAMGSVLALWHDARTAGLENPQNAALPDSTALENAAQHCSWDSVVIDIQAGTVYLSDPQQRLDVGAIAKGWAVQQVADELPAGYLISLGGNVCATGPKDDRGTGWNVAVNNPDGGDYLQTLSLIQGSVVTSGDYQRYFTVDGVDYHHIIDPQTQMPGKYWRSVTVICGDSGLADALSTALFLLPLTEGQALLEECGAEAMWVNAAGEIFCSPGFEAYTN